MYECKVCGKTYTRKIYGEQHYLVCKALSEAPSLGVQECEYEEQESGDTPTMHEMYTLIRILVQKVDRLEKENDKWKQKMRIQNKKIDVLEYLNKHVIPFNEKETDVFKWFDKQYDDMFKKEHVTIDSVFQDGIRKTASMMCINICQQFHENGEFNQLPIQCFNHKTDCLYIYTGGKWIVCTTEYQRTILQRMHKVILSHYFMWVDQNKVKMEKDNNFYQNTYIPYQQKAMILNITETQLMKLIYNQFSQPSSNLIAYSC